MLVVLPNPGLAETGMATANFTTKPPMRMLINRVFNCWKIYIFLRKTLSKPAFSPLVHLSTLLPQYSQVQRLCVCISARSPKYAYPIASMRVSARTCEECADQTNSIENSLLAFTTRRSFCATNLCAVAYQIAARPKRIRRALGCGRVVPNHGY